MLTKVIARKDFPKTGGRAPLYPYEQILATLGTTKAVFLEVPTDRRISVRSAIYKGLRRRGFTPRIRLDKGGLAVWVERP